MQITHTSSEDSLHMQTSIFKALGQPIRLLLVQHLRHGPATVGALTRQVDRDFSTVSRHLAELERVGILAKQRQGTSICYSVRLPCLGLLLDCLDQQYPDQGTCHV
ncbi:MAG: ArsR family transcriptional regulator [Planctomycetota bacterium]|nr:MAG: ArsR family transcriptional regulator [Planctomycetota bacterium]